MGDGLVCQSTARVPFESARRVGNQITRPTRSLWVLTALLLTLAVALMGATLAAGAGTIVWPIVFVVLAALFWILYGLRVRQLRRAYERDRANRTSLTPEALVVESTEEGVAVESYRWNWNQIACFAFVDQAAALTFKGRPGAIIIPITGYIDGRNPVSIDHVRASLREHVSEVPLKQLARRARTA